MQGIEMQSKVTILNLNKILNKKAKSTEYKKAKYYYNPNGKTCY